MKRHWILGVLWLMGCGAGSPTDDGSDSTLESPLTAEDDDITSGDLADSELASEFIPNAASDDDAVADDGAAHDDDAPEASSEAGEAAAGGPPLIVIGAGGQPWQAPDDAVVVWCHASVPLGCPAIEPAPNGGRLVVVTRSAEAGVFEHEAADEPDRGGAIGVSAPAPGTPPAPGSLPAPVTPAAAGVPAPASASPGAPRPPLPIDVGGSLPPLPGTCVAITFTGGESAEPASGPASAGGERATAMAPLPTAGEPASSAPSPLRGIPALPPSDGCIGVAFPAPPAPRPIQPPSTGAGPIGVPSPPGAAGCFGVAFASTSGEGDAAGISQTRAVAGAPAPHKPGMPFVCAANPPLPGVPHPGNPGAPWPPPAGSGGPIEGHHGSDAAPSTDEASVDEVR